MIPTATREQDGPDRYVAEPPTFSSARLGAGVAGRRTLLLADRSVGILYAADFHRDFRFCCEVPARSAPASGADRRLAAAGVDLDAHSAGHLHDLLCLGFANLLSGSAPA